MQVSEPGYDGAKLSTATVRLSLNRTEERAVRARPGTFEWRYGRKSADAALYLAGCHFADLWERAGTADARSPDLAGVGGGSGWKGLPDGRAVAIGEVNKAEINLGQLPSVRLRLYCVHGHTTSEIAQRFATTDRNMAPVLHEDLKACALHFRFLSKR